MRTTLYILGGILAGSLAGQLIYRGYARRAAKYYGVKL